MLALCALRPPVQRTLNRQRPGLTLPGMNQLQTAPPLSLVVVGFPRSDRFPFEICGTQRSLGNPPRLTLMATLSALVTFDLSRMPEPFALAAMGSARRHARSDSPKPMSRYPALHVTADNLNVRCAAWLA